MHNRYFIVCALLLLFTGSPASQADEQTVPRHAADNLPGVEPEMLTPGYWIGRMDDPDDIVMTPEEIRAFNERVRTTPVTFTERFGKPDPLEKGFAENLAKGLLMHPLDIFALPATMPGDTLKAHLDYNVDFLYSRDLYDDRNAVFNDRMREEIVEKMNIDAVPETVTRTYGLLVRHANVRYFPSTRPGFSETEWELDFFQATGVLIGNPVAILHESVDGDFLYVETPIARGWIDAQFIARGTPEEIRRITEAPRFLISTCDKVPVYADHSHTRFSRYLYMAASMPLVKTNDSGYVVTMGYRNPDGSLGVTYGYIKPDADVHEGYLPYTKRNVITTLFKLLDKPYGWGDQQNKRSCAGTMRVLFKCFGFRTGRYPSYILSSSDIRTYMNPDWSRERKHAELADVEPFITIAGSPFHVVLYIGKGHTGKHYFMHQAGWGYEDENGEHLIVNRTTINATDHVFYDIDRPAVFTTYKNRD